MNFLSYLLMFAWIPIICCLFLWMPSRSAVIVSFIAGWLFLPVAVFVLPGLPDYTKLSATCYGTLLAAIIFDSSRLISFRIRWLDMPAIVWFVCPLFSSLTNSLGLYDSISAVISQSVTWGIPYFLGRIYLNSFSALRQLAVNIFIGGLVYVPLCLIEVRISPQLHRILYGFSARERGFAQTMRLGGFRPTVFMEHGLMVAVWMVAATLTGIWLWRSGTLQKIWRVSVNWLVIILIFTFILIKSTGAYFYLALGLIVLYTSKWFRSALVLYLLIFSIFFYLCLNVTGNFSPAQREQVISYIANVVGEDRSQSLEYRLENEEILIEKAQKKLTFGWGGWGRSRVYSDSGQKITTTDSLWIIVFGNFGIVGLASFSISLLFPVLLFCWRFPAYTWHYPYVAPAAVIATIICLYMFDCLFNAMINPIFGLSVGGISGLLLNNKVLPTQIPQLSIINKYSMVNASVKKSKIRGQKCVDS